MDKREDFECWLLLVGFKPYDGLGAHEAANWELRGSLGAILIDLYISSDGAHVFLPQTIGGYPDKLQVSRTFEQTKKAVSDYIPKIMEKINGDEHPLP